MKRFTICGLAELDHHVDAGVTHVLSILDPDHPDPETFRRWPLHHRTLLRFHDVISERDDRQLPAKDHVEAVLRFGEELDRASPEHVLVHCHAGISRSSASVATLLARRRRQDLDEIFAEIRAVRPIAWPNSRMIAFADELLGHHGALVAALERHYRHQARLRPELAALIRNEGRAAEVPVEER